LPYQARKIASALGLKRELITQAIRLLLGVYKAWWECDASISRNQSALHHPDDRGQRGPDRG